MDAFIFHERAGVENRRTFAVLVRDLDASGDSSGRAAIGLARCSLQDQFSKKRGKLIAEGRAKAKLGGRGSDEFTGEAVLDPGFKADKRKVQAEILRTILISRFNFRPPEKEFRPVGLQHP